MDFSSVLQHQNHLELLMGSNPHYQSLESMILSSNPTLPPQQQQREQQDHQQEQEEQEQQEQEQHHHQQVVKPQQEKKPRPPDEILRCPRCDSPNTKFCYYNNYSLTQPRYFCKSCRRYWTKGGTLRTVPVGGGCRKNHRRPSSSSSSSSSSTTSSSSISHLSSSMLSMPSSFLVKQHTAQRSTSSSSSSQLRANHPTTTTNTTTPTTTLPLPLPQTLPLPLHQHQHQHQLHLPYHHNSNHDLNLAFTQRFSVVEQLGINHNHNHNHNHHHHHQQERVDHRLTHHHIRHNHHGLDSAAASETIQLDGGTSTDQTLINSIDEDSFRTLMFLNQQPPPPDHFIQNLSSYPGGRLFGTVAHNSPLIDVDGLGTTAINYTTNCTTSTPPPPTNNNINNTSNQQLPYHDDLISRPLLWGFPWQIMNNINGSDHHLHGINIPAETSTTTTTPAADHLQLHLDLDLRRDIWNNGLTTANNYPYINSCQELMNTAFI